MAAPRPSGENESGEYGSNIMLIARRIGETVMIGDDVYHPLPQGTGLPKRARSSSFCSVTRGGEQLPDFLGVRYSRLGRAAGGRFPIVGVGDLRDCLCSSTT